MHVNVPQFVDIEDKIAFGLTGKQLLWMIGMSAVLLVAYNTFQREAFYVAGFFIVMIFGALTFWRPQGISLMSFSGFTLQYFMKPRNYIWKRQYSSRNADISKAARSAQMRKLDTSANEAKKMPTGSQLQKIAWQLDTKK
jgi:hypothetical protein